MECFIFHWRESFTEIWRQEIFCWMENWTQKYLTLGCRESLKTQTHNKLKTQLVHWNGRWSSNRTVCYFYFTNKKIQKIKKIKKNLFKKKRFAPECCVDFTYSEKSDVWAFGITVIELVTRKAPYPDMNVVHVATKGNTKKLRWIDVIGLGLLIIFCDVSCLWSIGTLSGCWCWSKRFPIFEQMFLLQARG